MNHIKNSILPLVISLLTLFCFSCKKSNQTLTFTGRVTEATGGGSIEGVTIEFYDKKIQNGSINVNYTKVGETTTDQNGDYKFEYKRDRTIEVLVEVKDPKFHEQSVLFNDDDLSLVEDNITNFNIYHKSWVRFHLKNAPDANQTDELKLTKEQQIDNCLDCCSSETEVYNGEIDLNFTCASVGNLFFNFSYIVTDASGFQAFEDSVYCEPFDTTQIFITY